MDAKKSIVCPKPIPQQLKDSPRWCCWGWKEKSTGKFDKKPDASCNDPSTCFPFETVWKRYKRKGGPDGINFLPGGDGDLVPAVIDFDDCIDPETQVTDPRVEAIIKDLGTYAEYSPSGRGIHVWLLVPAGTRNIAKPKDGFEFYCSNHFMSFTGNRCCETTELAVVDADTPRRLFEEFTTSKPTEPQRAKEKPAHAADTTDDAPKQENPQVATARRCISLLSDERADAYNDWINVLCALKNIECEYDIDLSELWHAFSKRSAKYERHEAQAKYDEGFTQNVEGERLTLGSLLHWASEDSGKSTDEITGTFEIKTPKAEPTLLLKPVPASQLDQGDDMAGVEWIQDGWIAKGFYTLLVGFPKAGKTTFLSHVLKGTTLGGDTGGTIHPARCLVISEERRAKWTERRDQLGFADNVEFLLQPFLAKPTLKQWCEYVQAVKEVVVACQFDLVIIDTWQNISPVKDENDSAQTVASLLPLGHITRAGAGMVLCHHARKGDGTEGQASRGSGALAGYVDIMAELRRFSVQDPKDARRKIQGFSRFDETPTEVVIELVGNDYRTVGNVVNVTFQDRLKEVLAILTEKGEGMTVDAIRDGWSDDRVIGKRMLQKVLDRALKDGKLPDALR